MVVPSFVGSLYTIHGDRYTIGALALLAALTLPGGNSARELWRSAIPLGDISRGAYNVDSLIGTQRMTPTVGVRLLSKQQGYNHSP